MANRKHRPWHRLANAQIECRGHKVAEYTAKADRRYFGQLIDAGCDRSEYAITCSPCAPPGCCRGQPLRRRGADWNGTGDLLRRITAEFWALGTKPRSDPVIIQSFSRWHFALCGQRTMTHCTSTILKSTSRTAPASPSNMRLQKFLAASGVDSRRKCKVCIREGRVTVNGETITEPGFSVDPSRDNVLLDSERLRLPRLKYYLLNKPKGVLCTARDPAGRPLAIDLVPHRGERLFTVGRLDENTQGLLLITNDGGLAERLAHPRYEVTRRYRAQVVGVPSADTLSELCRGMHFSDGHFQFRQVRFLRRRGNSAILEIELREGRNREVRRLLARAGHKVIQLERTTFGPLRIGHLNVGQSRELRPAELKELRRFSAMTPDERRPTAGSSRRRTKHHSRAVGSSRRAGGSVRRRRHRKTASRTPE